VVPHFAQNAARLYRLIDPQSAVWLRASATNRRMTRTPPTRTRIEERMAVSIVEDTLDDLLYATYQAIHSEGRPIGPTRGPAHEVVGARLELTNPRARLSRTETRRREVSTIAELCWYLSGTNAGSPNRILPAGLQRGRRVRRHDPRRVRPSTVRRGIWRASTGGHRLAPAEAGLSPSRRTALRQHRSRASPIQGRALHVHSTVPPARRSAPSCSEHALE